MKAKSNKRRLGERLVAEFTELHNTLRDGKPVEKRFTVRTVELDLKPKQFDPESIRLIRLALGVSQAVFAEILGASKALVESWEQGHREPCKMACRLLELIEQDKNRWLKVLEQAMKENTV